jgi:hypothetical protein
MTLWNYIFPIEVWVFSFFLFFLGDGTLPVRCDASSRIWMGHIPIPSIRLTALGRIRRLLLLSYMIYPILQSRSKSFRLLPGSPGGGLAPPFACLLVRLPRESRNWPSIVQSELSYPPPLQKICDLNEGGMIRIPVGHLWREQCQRPFFFIFLTVNCKIMGEYYPPTCGGGMDY